MFQVLVVKCRYQTRVLFGEYLIFAGSDLGLFEVGFLEVGIFGAEIMDGKTGDLGEHLMNKGYRFQICWLFDELRRVLALMPWCFASPSQLLSYLGILSLQTNLWTLWTTPEFIGVYSTWCQPYGSPAQLALVKLWSASKHLKTVIDHQNLLQMCPLWPAKVVVSLHPRLICLWFTKTLPITLPIHIEQLDCQFYHPQDGYEISTKHHKTSS